LADTVPPFEETVPPSFDSWLGASSCLPRYSLSQQNQLQYHCLSVIVCYDEQITPRISV